MDDNAKTKNQPFSCLTKYFRPGVSLRDEVKQEDDGFEAKPETTKRKPSGWKSMPFIVGNETFERLAVSGQSGNFMTYLRREYHMNQVSATNLITIWIGITNFAPLIGAFLSDAYFGRFWAIAFGSFACLMGLLIMTLTAWIPNWKPPKCQQLQDQPNLQHCIGPNKAQLGILILSLGLLSTGTGGIRPCNIPFGIDQFDHTTEEGKSGIKSYLNWYYTTFTIAVMISLTVMVYIQDSVSWVLGFGIPTILMACSIILFFIGTKHYVYVKPEGSIFFDIAQVFVAAFKKRRLKLPDHDDDQEENQGQIYYDPEPPVGSLASKLRLTKQFRCLNKAAILVEEEVTDTYDGSCPNKYKWRLSSIQKIEEVKCIIKVLPIWSTGIICVASFLQQGTISISQAMSMDQKIGKHNFRIPPGSISVITMLTVGIWLPIYDRLIVPKLRKIRKNEDGITILQRMGIGLVFSIMSMIVAGLVEKRRKNVENSHPGGPIISILWLAPQFVISGFAEAFYFIGQIEFYNREFPENMRSIGTALFFVTFGVGSYFSSALVNVVHGLTGGHGKSDWFAEDINQGKLDYFYYLLAGMGAVNFFYFVVCASKYRYKRVIITHVEESEKP